MKIVGVLHLSLLLLGCGSTVKLGAGYDINYSRWDYAPEVVHIGDSAFIGLVEVETPRWKGLSGEYLHISNLGGSDYATVDVVALNVTCVLGGEKGWISLSD